MTITLPDDPALATLGEDEIRIDLARGAFAAGHLSRAVAARLAGLDRQAFDEILLARHTLPTTRTHWPKTWRLFAPSVLGDGRLGHICGLEKSWTPTEAGG